MRPCVASWDTPRDVRYRLTFRRRGRRGTTSRRLRRVTGTHPAAPSTPPKLERRDVTKVPSRPTSATPATTPRRLRGATRDAKAFLDDTPALAARFRAIELAAGSDRVAHVLERATGRRLSLKLLRTAATSDWDDWAALKTEAKTLRSLHHRGIPRWHEHGETEGGAYLLMERAPGLSLQARLDRGDRWSDVKLMRVLHRLLDILAYLQELNPPVFHGAIRPEHVVVSDRGDVALTSFGDARTLLTRNTPFVGDGEYFPAGAAPGPAADLYCAGATIAAVASGTNAGNLPRRGAGLDLTSCMRRSSVRDALEVALGQAGEGMSAAELSRRIRASPGA